MKTIALVIGFVLLALGVACFVPGLSDNGMLFGRFPASTMMAIAFIVTGAVGITIGLRRTRELGGPRSDGTPDLRDM